MKLNYKKVLNQSIKNTKILALSSLVFCAGEVYAQQQVIRLPEKAMTLQEIFKQIEKQTQMSVDYNNNKVTDAVRKKKMNIDGGNIQEVLDKALAGSGLSYRIEGNHIVIFQQSKPATGKKRTISGVIVDAAGIPVIGANIMVKGTAQGTITDLNGQFSLDVPAGTTLQISYIGMANQEIKIGNQTNLSITMKEDSEMLDELVVVGFGTQKKVNLTGAVTAVAGDDLTKRPVLNAENMLQGQVPGLSVIQKSGQPGSDNTSFRIRGQGTYSDAGSDPLVLVNGVPGSLSSLDPSIIESVSVLKDASSASIYGSRAANGVILVTTKKGADGKKFSATYSGNFSVYSPTKMLDMVTNSAEYMELYNIAKTNSQLGGLYDEAEIGKYKNSNGSLEFPSFDWVDYMFNPAFVQNHNLSLCGSSEKTDYNITLNLADQPGTMRGFNYNKYNFSHGSFI